MRLGIACKVAALAVVFAFGWMATAPPVRAADNQATGDIAGVGADLDDSNVFQLSTTTLALIKRAFLEDGTPLTSGASLPKGTVVKFLIYINNVTGVAVDDISVQDVLDPVFAYSAGTIKVDNSQTCAAATCTALEEDAIFAAVDAQSALTDAAAAGDVASYDGSNTIDVGNANEANNDQLDVAASSVWAVSFTVTMQ